MKTCILIDSQRRSQTIANLFESEDGSRLIFVEKNDRVTEVNVSDTISLDGYRYFIDTKNKNQKQGEA